MPSLRRLVNSLVRGPAQSWTFLGSAARARLKLANLIWDDGYRPLPWSEDDSGGYTADGQYHDAMAQSGGEEGAADEAGQRRRRRWPHSWLRNGYSVPLIIAGLVLLAILAFVIHVAVIHLIGSGRVGSEQVATSSSNTTMVGDGSEAGATTPSGTGGMMVMNPDPAQEPSAAVPPKYASNPTVNLGYRSYVGSALPNGVNQFLGMQYATPPLGDLRWRAPVAPVATQQTEQANQFKPICLSTDSGYPVGGQDEDCLYANVWAPANATTTSKLPVWIFISGGGYTSLSNANWNGSQVVQQSGNNIVFVNFNYRVGLYGFLASDKIKQNGDLNTGLLDQRFAMLWVKQHIAQFGGDPDHVVIHGASAGAGAVGIHLVANGGRNDGLFVGAMSESLFFPAQPFVPELEWQFDRVAQQLGCGTAADQMACLRSKDTATLQGVNRAQPFLGREGQSNPLFYWTPCIDGDFLQDLPYNLYESGRFINVPVLLGTGTDEGSVFAPNANTPADIATFFQNNYPHLTTNDTDAILQQYPQLPALPNHNAWFPSASEAYGEATFICPTINLLNAISTSAAPAAAGRQRPQQQPGVFAYRYNVQDDENTAQGLGVLHIFEAAAIFGPNNIGGGVRASYWSYNAPIVPVFMSYWISFVRLLDPSPLRSPGSPAWGPWGGRGSGGMRRLVVETGQTRMETTPSDQADRCDFWLGLGQVTEQKI